MKSLKLFLKTFIFILFICLLAKSWHLITDGFRMDKIRNNLKNDKLFSDNFYELNKIFNQKFNYLSKGCQTYVFESEDKNYVIKFVRYHRYSTPLWLDVFNFFDSYKNKRQIYKTKLLNASLNSYAAAYKYLKDETAIVYVHLSKTNNLNKKIQINNRLKMKYSIDLDNTGFLVQKKVKSLSDFLNKNKSNYQELRKITDSFLQTTRSIYLKGFNNDDYNCIKNSGIIDNKVIHSDLGSFLQKDLKDKDNFKKEFEHFMIYYKKWAKKNAPFLISYVDEEINKMSDEL
jgi:hypothetical protein